MQTVQRTSRYRRARWGVIAAMSLGIVGGVAAGPAAAADPNQLQSGDCLDGIHAGPIGGVNLLPCGAPHDAEVVGRLGGTFAWPGMKALTNDAARACAGLAARRVVNDRYALSAMALVPPNPVVWNRSHQVVCLVTERNGAKLVGSMMTPAPLSTGSG